MICRHKIILSVDEAKTVWQNTDAVCFDVDSTVIKEEGIDCLAEYCGKGDEVAEWTQKAMGGAVPFEQALQARLEIIQPHRTQVETFINTKPPTFTPGVSDLIKHLQQQKIPVYLVSGGFAEIINAQIAKPLGIPTERVYANKLEFDNEGNWIGFSKTEKTAYSGGKPKVMKELLQKFGYKNLVFIGDGATDLETKAVVSAFIGFGGNVVREKVKQQADWFVTNFEELKRVHMEGEES